MKVEFPFTIETSRCRLRVPTEFDIPHVFSATRYPGFNDGMPWDPPMTEEELKDPLQRSLEAWRTGSAYTFTIEKRKEGAFVGRIGIRSTVDSKVWNIGFWLHPTCEGQGLMTEAAEAVIDFGFDQLHAEAIEACHTTWNIKSRRVLERLGMKEVEYLPEGFLKRGAWIAEYRMRVTRAEKRPNKSPEPTPTAVTPRATDPNSK